MLVDGEKDYCWMWFFAVVETHEEEKDDWNWPVWLYEEDSESGLLLEIADKHMARGALGCCV